ncbi:MAG: hypothetical protein BRD23_07695 [Halobacteriales archaeon SW_9_67_25]|nr:MAG: hypothetical protein BRD23_07695 [Halobacteriales archaeon SW_9_67_25]
MSGDPGSGWRTVASWEEAPALFAALVELEPEREHTRAEIADAAGVSLETLYLADTLETLVEVGLLERPGGEGEETCYVIDGAHPVVDAARAFDNAVGTAVEGEQNR